MAYEQKDMSGALFRNHRKEKDSHPDYQGSVKVGDIEYWISGWRKETKDGDPWISLAFKGKDAPSEMKSAPLEEKATAPKRQAEATSADAGIRGMDEDIPFINIGRGISGHAI